MPNYKSDKRVSKEKIAKAFKINENSVNVVKRECPFSQLYMDTFNAEEYGERVRVCREELKLTQAMCGEMAGMTGAALSKIEKGDVKKLNQDHMYLLCAIFGTTPDYLLGLAENRNGVIEVQKDGSKLELRLPFEFGERTVSELAWLLSSDWIIAKFSYQKYPEECSQLCSILRCEDTEVQDAFYNEVKSIYSRFLDRLCKTPG